MRNLNFKYAAAKNFLPFGPEGIELHFEKYGKIILVRGENLDAKPIDQALPSEEMKVSSNGTGKSSLQEIIVWTLYGQTIKRPEKITIDDVIHNKVGSDCRTEVIVGPYRVVRTRCEGGKKGKNTLRFWESENGIWDKDTELTQGDMRVTQKEIEKKLGLTYDAFINVCIFTDDQRSCFLECGNPIKREIVENMLALSEYREWFEKAKADRKEIKGRVDTKAQEYKLLLSNKDDAERRLNLTQSKLEAWIKQKQEEQSALEKKITALLKSLSSTDTGAALVAYQEAQAKIEEINNKIPTVEAERDNLNRMLQLAREKEVVLREEAQKITKQSEEYNRIIKQKMDEKRKKESEIADLESETPGTKCSKCRGLIQEENIQDYTDELKRDIAEISLELQKYVLSLKEVGKNMEELTEKQKKVKTYVGQFMTKLGKQEEELKDLRHDLVLASQVREPKADSAEVLLQQQVETVRKQLGEKVEELKGPSPFQDILDNDKLELSKIKLAVDQKDQEVKTLEAELPYYDYWIKGFGEHGIRKWVIEGIIPELNSRINYWLQFLIDNKITLKFDSQLQEVIERNPVDGDPYVYHAMSTGQRRRLNLAVSQSFAHIMMLSSNAIPSLVFLDEVSTNVDPQGVQGIYNMICELAEDKQVFITTHDPDLIRMLQGADVIKLVHKDGFTKMI